MSAHTHPLLLEMVGGALTVCEDIIRGFFAASAATAGTGSSWGSPLDWGSTSLPEESLECALKPALNQGISRRARGRARLMPDPFGLRVEHEHWRAEPLVAA